MHRRVPVSGALQPSTAAAPPTASPATVRRGTPLAFATPAAHRARKGGTDGKDSHRRGHRGHPGDLAPGRLRLEHLLAQQQRLPHRRCGNAGERRPTKRRSGGQRDWCRKAHRPSLCAGRASEVRPDQPPEMRPETALDATLDLSPDPSSVTARTREAARDRARDWPTGSFHRSWRGGSSGPRSFAARPRASSQ
jgi:hypothetical protein